MAESALADESKFHEYMLNPAHPDGAPKARYFANLGFTADNWEALRDEILRELPHVHGRYNRQYKDGAEGWEALMRVRGPFGEGDVLTTWSVRPGAPPVLCGAHPYRRRRWLRPY